jgi:hypothetical protein
MSANVLTRRQLLASTAALVAAPVASVDLPATFLDYAGGNPATKPWARGITLVAFPWPSGRRSVA